MAPKKTSHDPDIAEIQQARIIKKQNLELTQKNKQLEEILSLLQNAQNSLIESESRFRSVAESANDAIITADESGHISFWNKMAEKLFGYSKNEAIGKPLTILMPQRYQERHRNGLKHFFKTGEGKIIGKITELAAVKKDGNEFPIELTLADWETHDSKYVTGIVRDISKRKNEEDALRVTQEQLYQSEKMSTLGRMSAGIAHELNNPAASVKRSASQMHTVFNDLQNYYLQMSRYHLTENQKDTLIELAQRAKEGAKDPQILDPATRSDKEQEIENWCETKGIDNAWELAPSLISLRYDQKELSDLIEVFSASLFHIVLNWQNAIFTINTLLYEMDLGANRISDIVKAFKTYTYMDQIPLQEVNIHKDLDNTLIIFSSKLKHGITLERQYATNLPRVEAYGSELNQVWTNLIDNALDAMNGKGKLIVRTSSTKKSVTIEIMDNGPGIPQEIQEKIFDPYFTTKKVGIGSGMGLSISHNIIVQKHHGKISLSSIPGETIFKVILPIRYQKTKT